MSSPSTPPNRIALREFIVKRFSLDDFFIFVSDEFPDFYERYEGNRADKVVLANKLIAHCEHRGEMLRLQVSLQKSRPQLYEAAFGKVVAPKIERKPATRAKSSSATPPKMPTLRAGWPKTCAPPG
ncbi:MAG: hypothetical protein HC853_01270 [Anaerolineae bacterium]|nr:hypothetical protein [Anaerolineae bacterium]